MRSITFLSGKGGAGKSSFCASLALILSRKYKIICADCDVDASNLALTFGIKEKNYRSWDKLMAAEKAEFDLDKCDGCGLCREHCYFDAIELNEKKPSLKEFSCEGCGVCELVCPKKAVKLVKTNNARIGWTETNHGFKIVSAQLEMGESGSGRVVAEVKKKAEFLSEGAEIILIDSAAGIACPVIASVSGSDYCVLVAEATPLGVFDMKRAYEVAGHFNIPGGIIINKFDLNPKSCREIINFAKHKGWQILGRVPFDKVFSRALVRMEPVVLCDENIHEIFTDIAEKLSNAVGTGR